MARTKDRIARIFQELEEKGKLPKQPARPKTVKSKPKPKTVRVGYYCCLDRHAGNIPQGFRQCIDCPKLENNT